MPKEAESPALLTRHEAARFLRVSLDAIDKFRGDPIAPLPSLKVGRRFLFVPADLVEWGRKAAERETKARARAARGTR